MVAGVRFELTTFGLCTNCRSVPTGRLNAPDVHFVVASSPPTDGARPLRRRKNNNRQVYRWKNPRLRKGGFHDRNQCYTTRQGASRCNSSVSCERFRRGPGRNTQAHRRDQVARTRNSDRRNPRSTARDNAGGGTLLG